MSTPPKPDLLNDPITSSNNIDAAPPPPAYHVDTAPATNGLATESPSKGFASNVKSTTTNGQVCPVAQNIKTAYSNTQSDFQGLAKSNATPEATTATGQPLTTYHSFFYNLLTWKHPRATLISFVANVAMIFIARYFPLTKLLFRTLAMAFGATVVAELAGKPFAATGLASHFRPKQYYVLPRETIDSVFSELHELLNFFVLEFQRILFVENMVLTATASLTSLIAYGLIKLVPLWGLTLIATGVMYLAPLVYIKNKELIDAQLVNASDMVNSQAAQVKDITAHHTARATEAAKTYASDLSTRAGDLVGQAKSSVASSAPAAPKHEPISNKSFPEVPSKQPLKAGSQPVIVN